MPVIPTEKQKQFFEYLKQHLARKGYDDLGYTGENDDSYKFGDKIIRCYVKFISVRARRHPPESMKVVVRQNKRNEKVKEFLIGNDFHGQGSRHVFVIPGDIDSYRKALKLINTI